MKHIISYQLWEAYLFKEFNPNWSDYNKVEDVLGDW